jgi:hypothetical protein
MMRLQETPARLFYDFCLDEHVTRRSPTGLRLTQLDRGGTPTSSDRFQAASGSPRRSRKPRPARLRNTLPLSTTRRSAPPRP